MLSKMEIQELSSANFVWYGVLIIAFVAYGYHRWATSWRVVPKYIPWVPTDLKYNGLFGSSFARVRAHLRDLANGSELAEEGYIQVHTHLSQSRYES